MSTGADPKTMPGTAAFRDGYDRLYGERRPQRGRWVYDQRQQRLVPAHEYIAPEIARNAPVMVDRFMEGASTQDGTDISSRAKRREYMKATGSADASDFSRGYFDKRREGRDREVAESTRKTVAEVSKMDPRHMPKFIEEGKKR